MILIDYRFTGAGSYNNTEFYPPEADPYYHSYEPTQDLQWAQQVCIGKLVMILSFFTAYSTNSN
jgi:hypothetical protein